MVDAAAVRSTWAPLLLADPSPILRSRVLRDLLGHGEDDPEVAELLAIKDTDRLVDDLLVEQSADGSWSRGSGGVLQTTAQGLLRLGYLGYGPEHRPVERAADFLFSRQAEDGSWPLNSYDETSERYGNYSMIPLQTTMPLRALSSCGYAEDPRSEKAYEWLLSVRLDDGAWPSGMASGNYGSVAGYRRISHSRWGCRTNTTGVLLCLAMHPARRTSDEARRALDLLLGRASRERHSLGFEVARLVGAEPAKGLFTYFARFDVALILDLCWRVGGSLEDERILKLVEFVIKAQGPYGLWEYERQPHVSRWVTYDVLRSLTQIDEVSDWISLEPSTPFTPYPKRGRRY
jgi:hypothetical protein